MITELVTSREQFDALRPHWEALIAEARHPELFDTWEWSAACLDSVHAENNSLFMITVKVDERYVGIAPFRLVNMKRGGVMTRTLQLINYGMAVYGNIHLDRRYSMRSLLKRIVEELTRQRELWDYIELINLNSRQQMVYMAHYLFKETYNTFLVEADVSSSIRYESYSEERVNRKEIRNIVSRQKKLFKAFKVRIVIDQAYSLSLWERMLELYAEKWGSMHPDYRRFCEALFPQLNDKHQIGFSYIEINGQIQAMTVTQRMNNKIYGVLTNYSTDYAMWGLSVMLIHSMVEHYRETKMEELDFLNGAQAYKLNWTNSWRRNNHVFICNNSYKGLYLSFYTWMRNIAKESTTLCKLRRRFRRQTRSASKPRKGKNEHNVENGDYVKQPHLEKMGG